MKLSQPFKFILTINENRLSELKSFVEDIDPHIWKINASRKAEFPYHKAVDTIVLKYCSNETYQDAKWNDEYQNIIDTFLPIMNEISDHHGHSDPSYSRVMLAKLDPHSKILRHYDYEDVHHYTHRIYLPLITNDQVFFTVAEETRVLKEGEVYEISNKDYHHVVNESPKPRVHLIFDLIEKEIAS